MTLLRRSRPQTSSVVAAPRKVVLGVDPSLRSTGIAFRDNRGNIRTSRIETGILRGPWRLAYAVNQLNRWMDQIQPTDVVYEDYAMAGKGRVFDIGELGGVLKHAIWTRGVNIHLVAPMGLKKFVTGKGNPGGKKKLSDKQKKAFISEALLRDFGVDIEQNDEADAAGLLLFYEVKTGMTKLPIDALQFPRKQALQEFSTIEGQLKSIAKA